MILSYWQRRLKPVLVALSGGLDSAMALYLLKKQGWNCQGVSLKIPVFKGKKNFASAEKICQILKVPYWQIDAQKEFKKKVVDYFIASYKKGYTPNPCMVCNASVKFKTLFEFAKNKKINYIATGHYAQIAENKKGKIKNHQLLTAKDKEKDQSYYLAMLPKKYLEHLVFPLGTYKKEEVIKMAKKLGFDFLLKNKSSQDFCYLKNCSLHFFLKKVLGFKKGEIIDTQGAILGKHRGLHFYTLGQRKGIGLPSGPWFVKNFDFKKNRLVVCKNIKDLYQKELVVYPFNWLGEKKDLKKKFLKAEVKTRYRQKIKPAFIYFLKNKKIKVVFGKKQKISAPGQFAVFYQKEVCLGGGRIL